VLSATGPNRTYLWSGTIDAQQKFSSFVAFNGGGLFAPSLPISPTQQKVASCARGRSKRVSAMTHKAITLKFVVPTVLAVALGISIGAVYLTNRYLGPVEQSEANR